MPLTPGDIYIKKFKKVMRGFDPQEVEDFLDIVATYYEEVLRENNELKEKFLEIDRMRTIETEKLELLRATIQKEVEESGKLVEERRNEANKEAELIIRDAEDKAKDIVHGAQYEASRILEEAKEEMNAKERHYKELEESEKLFKIRFKTLLESHLGMLSKGDLEKNVIAEEEVKKVKFRNVHQADFTKNTLSEESS